MIVIRHTLTLVLSFAITSAAYAAGTPRNQFSELERCLNDAVRSSECLSFLAAVPENVTVQDISCPTSPIADGAVVHGTLNQNNDCWVLIPTNLGTVKDIADVYAFSAQAGSTLTATLDSTNQYFGLPYLGLLDATGRIVAAKVGTTSLGGSAYRAVLSTTIDTGGNYRLLISGLGAPFSTAVGDYTLSFSLRQPVHPRRRAVRH